MTGTVTNNISSIERVIRFFLGCSLIGYVMLMPGLLGYMALMPLIGIYPCLTAITGWDPMYFLYGFNSDKYETVFHNRFIPESSQDLLRPHFI